MNLDEMLGIDPTDAVAMRAEQLLAADRKLMADLVARRHELGLSQEEVARRMDTSQPVVARIESGVRDMHQSTLRRYAMAVETTIEHVVVPDDRGRVRSTQVLADLRSQLAETHEQDHWLTLLWQAGEPVPTHWAGVERPDRWATDVRRRTRANV